MKGVGLSRIYSLRHQLELVWNVKYGDGWPFTILNPDVGPTFTHCLPNYLLSSKIYLLTTFVLMKTASSLKMSLYRCNSVWDQVKGRFFLVMGTMIVHSCVCVGTQMLELFHIQLKCTLNRTQNLYHKVINSKIYSYFYSLLRNGSFFQSLSRPGVAILLLPPAGSRFRDVLNMPWIDFPSEFTLLLKIQSIKWGDNFNTNVDSCRYCHTVVKQACRNHTNCKYTCTHWPSSGDLCFNSVWYLGDLTGPL